LVKQSRKLVGNGLIENFLICSSQAGAERFPPSTLFDFVARICGIAVGFRRRLLFRFVRHFLTALWRRLLHIHKSATAEDGKNFSTEDETLFVSEGSLKRQLFCEFSSQT